MPQVEIQSSESSPTNVETTKELLLKIISKANNNRLRTVLTNILDKHGQLEEWLVEELLVPESAVKQGRERNDDSEDDTMEGDDRQLKCPSESFSNT
jgi:hypothetical protein